MIQVTYEELISQEWFVYSDEITEISQLDNCDMDDVFQLIRVEYINPEISVVISDWRYDSGDFYLSFDKEI